MWRRSSRRTLAITKAGTRLRKAIGSSRNKRFPNNARMKRSKLSRQACGSRVPFRFLAGRQVGEFLIASRDLFPCFPGDRIDSPCNLRLGLARLLEMVLAAFAIDHVDTPISVYPNALIGTWFLGPW